MRLPESDGCIQVFVVMLAQEFPEGDTTVAQRLFSTGVAIVGLIFFALILALTEQVNASLLRLTLLQTLLM